MALYKEHNASPLGGCLPMLLPFPVFFALFRVLEGLSRMTKAARTQDAEVPDSSTQMYNDISAPGGHAQVLRDGPVQVGRSASSGSSWTTLPFFVLLLMMVGTQYYQQRQMTSRNPAGSPGPAGPDHEVLPAPVRRDLASASPPAWSSTGRSATSSGSSSSGPCTATTRRSRRSSTKDIKEVEAKTREIDEHGSKPAKPRFRDLLSGAALADNGKNRAKPPPAKPGPNKTPPKPPRTAKPTGAAEDASQGDADRETIGAKAAPPPPDRSPRPRPQNVQWGDQRQEPAARREEAARPRRRHDGQGQRRQPGRGQGCPAETDADRRVQNGGTNGANGAPQRGRTGGSGARPTNAIVEAGSNMEWVETTGRTIEEAKDAALDQLGVDETGCRVRDRRGAQVRLFGRLRAEGRVRARVPADHPRPKDDRRDRRKRKPKTDDTVPYA